MKNSILTITLIFFGFLHSSAQNIMAETYVEKTHISPKLGSSVGYQFLSGIQVGGFLQRSVEVQAPEYGRPLTQENSLYGIFFAYPIPTKLKWIDLHLKTRTGVMNNQNFVITPSFHGTYTPFKLLAVSAGVGIRSFQPAYHFALKINLLGKTTAD